MQKFHLPPKSCTVHVVRIAVHAFEYILLYPHHGYIPDRHPASCVSALPSQPKPSSSFRCFDLVLEPNLPVFSAKLEWRSSHEVANGTVNPATEK